MFQILTTHGSRPEEISLMSGPSLCDGMILYFCDPFVLDVGNNGSISDMFHTYL